MATNTPNDHAGEVAAEFCPVCSRRLKSADETNRYLPFCSRRCQQVDLFRWMDGRYAITEELPDDEDFLTDV